MSMNSHRSRRLSLFLGLTLTLLAAAWPGSALAATTTKVVRYHGYQLTVPASWPVYHLQAHATTCVRFDRHAVYLGQPGTDQRCPAVAAGRTEAILVQALHRGASAADVLPLATSARAIRGGATAAQLVNTAHGVVVTATWNRQPAVIQRALGVRSLTAAHAAAQARPSAVTRTAALMRSDATARTTTPESEPGEVYTGSGFDACNTPSSSQMAAWGSSPYRALGVYIGGANMACSQPNLTAEWVTQQSADGWHLVPIYVGLQAPSNSCGCDAMSSSPTSAAGEGSAAASDAVADAQAIGLGAGNPLYLDMEAYTRNSTNTAAVLAFIQAWTQELHVDGYRAGVYSSDDSGIVDLVDQYGTGYTEPDDIWIANWNDEKSTSDGNVPSQDWASHQRLHQYEGAHNETYDGTTINIDGDYIDASTAAAGTGSGVDATPTPAAAPSLAVTPVADGATDLTPSWLYATGVTSWQLLAGSSPTSLAPLGTPVGVGTKMPIVSSNAFAYYAVTALGSADQPLGTSAPIPTPAHLAIFGQSTFAPRVGLAGVPVGCANTTACTGVRVTISIGRTTLLRTGSERIPIGGGLAYFSLSARQHLTLWEARHHEQLVKVTVTGSHLATVSRPLMLTSFSTFDPNPKRSLTPSSALRLIGTSDFVSNGWVGGILAECTSSTPCQATTKIVSHGKVIAQTHAQTLGVGETGYLMFTLTRAGHELLGQTVGNQMPATVTVKVGATTATGHLALSAYN